MLLRTRSLSKRYPGAFALDDFDFEIRRGEVQSLTGENGAGKSTLVRILTGAIAADSGSVFIDGEAVAIRSPADARRLGIAAVQQDFDLAPNLTVAENLVLGREPQRLAGFVDRAREFELARTCLDAVGLNVDPDRAVARLSMAERQLVAIAAAIASPVRLLVLDEPTSSLAADEIEHLLGLVERQRDAGIAVLFISHKLEEVFRLSDRITVLRDGRKVGTRQASETDPAEIVSMMVGRQLKPHARRHRAENGAGLLEVRDLQARGLRGRIAFVVRRGEIVGLYGLKGAGRIRLLRALFGLDPPRAGEVGLAGKRLKIRSPGDAMRAGIGWACRDRKELGLFGNLNLRENLSIAALDSLARGGFVKRRAERRVVLEYLRRLAIKAAGPDQAITTLSGGNQQKVLLARWLLCRPQVLILDEPTAGVDVAAKSEIYELVHQLSAEGIGCLLVSSELPEVLTLSDRILVMHEGAMVGELDGAAAGENEVMQLVHAHGLHDAGRQRDPG